MKATNHSLERTGFTKFITDIIVQVGYFYQENDEQRKARKEEEDKGLLALPVDHQHVEYFLTEGCEYDELYCYVKAEQIKFICIRLFNGQEPCRVVMARPVDDAFNIDEIVDDYDSFVSERDEYCC